MLHGTDGNVQGKSGTHSGNQKQTPCVPWVEREEHGTRSLDQILHNEQTAQRPDALGGLFYDSTYQYDQPRSTALTGAASAPTILRGSAISSYVPACTSDRHNDSRIWIPAEARAWWMGRSLLSMESPDGTSTPTRTTPCSF